MTGTFAKLKDGSWGIQVKAQSRRGDIVLVRKKDGTALMHELGDEVESTAYGTVFRAGAQVTVPEVLALLAALREELVRLRAAPIRVIESEHPAHVTG